MPSRHWVLEASAWPEENAGQELKGTCHYKATAKLKWISFIIYRDTWDYLCSTTVSKCVFCAKGAIRRQGTCSSLLAPELKGPSRLLSWEGCPLNAPPASLNMAHFSRRLSRLEIDKPKGFLHLVVMEMEETVGGQTGGRFRAMWWMREKEKKIFRIYVVTVKQQLCLWNCQPTGFWRVWWGRVTRHHNVGLWTAEELRGLSVSAASSPLRSEAYQL